MPRGDSHPPAPVVGAIGEVRSSRAARPLLLVAAHGRPGNGLFSLHWAAGGTWLLSTLGHQRVAPFAGRRWLLVPVSLIKIGSGCCRCRWRAGAGPRLASGEPSHWAGTGVLVIWGGEHTHRHLVLSGILVPGSVDDARVGRERRSWLVEVCGR